MDMTMKEWLSKIGLEGVRKPIPILSFPGIQILNIPLKEMINNSDLQSECMKVIAERYDTLASVSLMDLSVEVECFGSNIRFSDDEVPTVVGALVSNQEEIDALVIPPVGSFRTGVYIASLQKALIKVTDCPIFASVIGPFSLAGRLMNISKIMVNCMDEPEMIHALMEKTTQFIIDYSRAYKEIGAHGIVVAEPMAGLLSPGFHREFSMPYMKRITDELQDDNFLVVYHNCGPYTAQQAADIFSIGAKIYHFGNAIDLADVFFTGNVAPADHIKKGTVESTMEATKAVLKTCGRLPNFILSTGCDVPPMAPMANMDAFFAAASDYYNS